MLKTPFAQLRKEEKKKVKTLCCSWRFSDVSLIGQDRSQTSIGGVLLSELKASSCESKNFPGLHVVGEAMDAAGICGGFNIHWACATGIVAGRSIVNNKL
ncbi:MAG: NAD(P)/FAD-dependent oxidoreductase [Patescibacteria group bacterium]|nr:NAD(P)/FAD-dependent oxidoreductase [Patescibacteria group bacterium]